MQKQKPEIPRLWPNPEESSTVRVIGDFTPADALNSAGINERRHIGATSDEEELKHRLFMSRYIQILRKAWPFILKQSVRSFPNSGEQLFAEFDPALPRIDYWRQVDKLIGLLERGTSTPPRVQAVIDELKSWKDHEAVEKELASQVQEEMGKAVYVYGFVGFAVKLDKYDETNKSGRRDVLEVNAHALSFGCEDRDAYWGCFVHSPYLNDARYLQTPEFLADLDSDNSLRKVSDLVTKTINDIRRNRAYKKLAMNKLPDEILYDLQADLRAFIDSWEFPKQAYSCGALYLNFDVVVNFSFVNNELSYTICAVYGGGEDALHETPHAELFSVPSVPKEISLRVSRKTISEIHDSRCQANNRGARLEELHHQMRFLARLEKTCPSLLSIRRQPTIESSSTICWQTFNAVCAQLDTAGIFDESRNQREYLAGVLAQLQQGIRTLQNVEEQARRLGTKLCLPTLLTDDHNIVAFNDLFPLTLARGETPEGLVPFNNIPPLNGQIINLTGAHGGGKTQTLLSATYNLWLAHCGLPVFASSFSFNAKELIGLLLLNRSSGSTCDQMVRKATHMLNQIATLKPNKAVLILDEVGTGTQESGGQEFGTDLIDALRQKGVSVFMSTQIMNLSADIQTQGGICLAIDRAHRIKPGISSGEIGALRKEAGFDQAVATLRRR